VRFLDYLLRPEIAGRVSNFSCYATTLPGARAYVDRWITNGAAYFINPAGRDFHLEETSTVSPVFARTWAEVRQRWR
jgi:spermidine/putrescine-binding protein